MNPRFPQSSRLGELEEFYRIPNDSLCKSTLLGFKDSMQIAGPWTMLEQRERMNAARFASQDHQQQGVPVEHFHTFASSKAAHSSGIRTDPQEADHHNESLHNARYDLSNKPSRVNFQDRTALRNQMDPRASSEEHYRVAFNNEQSRNSSANKDGLRQTTAILKSSSKYSKPPILQNTSALGLGSSGMRAHQSFGGANNRSMRMNPDHDDLKLKLDKLVANFLAKNGEKDSFKDTFFDQEIFQEIVDSKNYFKLSLDLLKYVLHSGNQPKKKKDDGKKKTGYGK
jgi:hypothetical protein